MIDSIQGNPVWRGADRSPKTRVPYEAGFRAIVPGLGGERLGHLVRWVVPSPEENSLNATTSHFAHEL